MDWNVCRTSCCMLGSRTTGDMGGLPGAVGHGGAEARGHRRLLGVGQGTVLWTERGVCVLVGNGGWCGEKGETLFSLG